MRHRPLALAVFLGVSIAVADAQQPPPQRAPGTVREGVHAVVLDVVVRDKRGQPVRDLSASDFEIVEDGVAQKIGSFTPVFEGVAMSEPTVPAPPAAAGAPTATTGPAPAAKPYGGELVVTALVFDRLTPEARKLATQAAQAYIGARLETTSYIGIFGIDVSLTAYAPFSRDGYVLRQALNRMAGRGSATSNQAEQTQQRIQADERAAAAEQSAANAITNAATTGGSVGTAAGDAILAEMQSRAIAEFEVMEHDQSGYATTDGLLAIVNAMRALPGRKSLILFSEGIAIPPAVQRLFLGVVNAANRANVSIYTMDAAGLRAESENAKIGNEVNRTAAGGGGILSSNRGGGPLTKALEKNEYVLRQDPHSSLGTLAESTGGLNFDSTNNLRQGFDRIETDLRNYYLVGYMPGNDVYDGRFRTIDVKVKRPGVTVAARKGYFAVRDNGGEPINSWEAPALGELERKPVPNAFPVRAAAMLFPERDRPGLVPVIVDLKTQPLTFKPAADGKTYTSDFAVIVRFLDQQNQVVRKLSQHYEITGPIGDIDRAKQGEVIFYREPELLAGVYTMETVVYDALSGRSSVRISTVDVPGQNPAALRASSLVIVTRAEKVPGSERRASNPLLVKDLAISPNLGDPISKGSAQDVGFYITVYPAASAPAPQATLQLLLNDVSLAEVPLPLGPPDDSGRIQQLGRLPIGPIVPGTYELRVIVKQGGAQVVRSILVRITN